MAQSQINNTYAQLIDRPGATDAESRRYCLMVKAPTLMAAEERLLSEVHTIGAAAASIVFPLNFTGGVTGFALGGAPLIQRTTTSTQKSRTKSRPHRSNAEIAARAAGQQKKSPGGSKKK